MFVFLWPFCSPRAVVHAWTHIMSRLAKLLSSWDGLPGGSLASVGNRCGAQAKRSSTSIGTRIALKSEDGSSSRLGRLLQPSAKSATPSPAKRKLQASVWSKRPRDTPRSTGKRQKTKSATIAATLPDQVLVESVEAHKRRHPTFDASCPRCVFQKNGGYLKRLATCGGRTWLAEKPPHMAGRWAVGCLACAAWLASKANQSGAQKRQPGGGKWQAKTRASKWARFQVTRLLSTASMASMLSNHQCTSSHRQAMRHFLNIDTPVASSQEAGLAADVATSSISSPLSSSQEAGSSTSLSAQAEVEAGLTAAQAAAQAEAEALLKGRVPQLQDWIDAWASASSTVSFRKEARIRQKKGAARRSDGVRKRLRKQIRVIADVLRDRRRQALAAATSITLAVDSRGKYKVARFRCDSRHRPYFVDGILGVFHCGYESLEDAERDHGARMQRNLQQCITRFWTPLGEGGAHLADQEAEMLSKVRCLSSDGGPSERKLMFRLVRTICPQVVLVIRDFAHAARIAVQRPQQFDPMFNAVHTHLFNNGLSEKKHAVIPDIQYSDKLKDLLESAQRVYLRIPASRHPLNVVLRHMSYAKHRFDSMADPVAKAAVMLLPICTLMSIVSCDQRVAKDKRERAASALRLFTPKFCLSLGALADYNLLTQSFIRKFDCQHHDIAASEREISHFERKMRKIFVDGWFLASHAETAAGVGPLKLKGTFITELVRKQTKQAAVFHAGPKQLLVWGRNTPDEVREVAGRCAYMTEVMLERLRADSDSDQLRSSFQAFDVPSMREGRLDQPQDLDEGPNAVRRACIKGIRRLAVALKFDADLQRCVSLEYVDVAASICNEAGLAAQPDNRELWCNVLDDAWLRKKFPHRIAPIVNLQQIVRLYISVLDGECQVGRDLGGGYVGSERALQHRHWWGRRFDGSEIK